MPPQEIDISSTAVTLIREHGDRAPIFAAMEADAHLEEGDLDGAVHWQRVLWAMRQTLEPVGTTQ
jgi:hypothetical protein